MDTEIYKALSDESRLRILNVLMQRELCVCEIEVILGMSQSNASRHLNKLKQAGIVTSKKESQWAYYDISNQFAVEHANLCKHLAKSFQADEVLLKDIEKLSMLKEQCNN